jgi:ribosome-binding factor A
MEVSRRIKSANINLRDEIASIINREIDTNDFLMTVTRVDTAKDLKSLKVFISVLPKNKAQKALKILKKSTYEIKNQLAKKVKMKYIPKINFFSDEGYANYLAIEKTIKKLKSEK